MSEFDEKYNKIIEDISKNIKDEKELQFVKEKMNELSAIFINMFNQVNNSSEKRITDLEKNQKGLEEKINKVENAKFICGDVEFAFDELINKKKIIPTAIIVDPPRKGLDEKTIQNILKIKPEKLVYISCNPATMVRDIAKTEGVYVAEKIQPVDMFPYTSSVECVAVLKLK